MAAVLANDAPDALALLRERRRAGDVILVKASRGLRAERVVEGLQQDTGRTEAEHTAVGERAPGERAPR
jgi:hypothetical protein